MKLKLTVRLLAIAAVAGTPPNTGAAAISIPGLASTSPSRTKMSTSIYRTSSGRRWINDAEKPLTTRSIHGKVSAKTTKIAIARGMKARTLS